VIRCDVLAPSNFYLFSKLKEFMKGHKFSDKDVICTAMLKSDKIRCAYLVVSCVRLRTF